MSSQQNDQPAVIMQPQFESLLSKFEALSLAHKRLENRVSDLQQELNECQQALQAERGQTQQVTRLAVQQLQEWTLEGSQLPLRSAWRSRCAASPFTFTSRIIEVTCHCISFLSHVPLQLLKTHGPGFALNKRRTLAPQTLTKTWQNWHAPLSCSCATLFKIVPILSCDCVHR